MRNGFIAVAESDQTIGEVINIGSGYEISIGETVKIITGIMNSHLEIEKDVQRVRPENSEVERLWADNRKANTLTGWAPSYGGVEGLKRGLRETVAWFTNTEHLRQYKASEYNI